MSSFQILFSARGVLEYILLALFSSKGFDSSKGVYLGGEDLYRIFNFVFQTGYLFVLFLRLSSFLFRGGIFPPRKNRRKNQGYRKLSPIGKIASKTLDTIGDSCLKVHTAVLAGDGADYCNSKYRGAAAMYYARVYLCIKLAFK